MANDDVMGYTPETILRMATTIHETRKDLLFCECDGADAESEQHFMMALDLLSMAAHHLNLAALKQSQGIAAFGKTEGVK